MDAFLSLEKWVSVYMKEQRIKQSFFNLFQPDESEHTKTGDNHNDLDSDVARQLDRNYKEILKHKRGMSQ